MEGMAKADDPAIETLIEAARIEFAQSLPGKADALAAQAERGAWDDIRRAAHKLRGSAAVYGFGAVGSVAAAVEDLLFQAGAAPDASAISRIRALLASLGDQAARAEREAQ
jgi:HPt (histidine-containing phosphotransfer) domain-containing protein